MTAAAPPIPTSVKVARMRAARSHVAERVARLNLYALRDRYNGGEQVALSAIGFATMTLWSAEAVHRESMSRYQQTIAARAALPAAERWSERGLIEWLTAALKAGPTLKDRKPEPMAEPEDDR